MQEKEKIVRDSSLILKLNNYHYNQEVFDDVLFFKTKGYVPEHIKPKTRFKEKWTPFYVSNNHLIYRPKDLKVIIDPNEKEEVLNILKNRKKLVKSNKTH